MNTLIKKRLELLTRAYFNLQPRDQKALVIMTIVLSLLTVYGVVWKPVNDWANLQEINYQQQLQDEQWIANNLPETQNSNIAEGTSQPVNTVVGAAARASNIQISRVQPRKTGLSIWVDESPYQDFLNWIVILETTHHLKVGQMRISRLKQPGLITGYLQVTR